MLAFVQHGIVCDCLRVENGDVGDSLKLDNILFYENHHYTFSGYLKFQREDIHRFGYAPLLKYLINERWAIMGALWFYGLERAEPS